MAAEIVLRASRRAGELLATMDRERGGRPKQSLDETILPKLEDISIVKSQSSRWQKLAEKDEEEFEQAIAVAKDKYGEINTANVTRELTRAGREAAKKEVQEAPSPKGKYKCIVIDPPWPMVRIERENVPKCVGFDYQTMSIEEI